MRRSVVGLVLITACSAGRPSLSAAPHRECVSGVIGTVGPAATAAVVARADDVIVELGGEFARSVGRLTGALVTVCGSSQSVGHLSVESLELREVDGMTAYLGILAESQGGWILEPGNDRASIPLADVPSDLTRAASTHVWVAGSWIENRLRVASFGVLSNWGNDSD